jgi:hypothetical protein
VIKPGIGYFQAEGIFPGQTITHGISGLAIGQTFQKLKDGHQCQPPRGESGLAVSGKEIGKCLISVDGSQRVTQLDDHMATGKGCMSHTSRFFWNRRNRESFQRHR